MLAAANLLFRHRYLLAALAGRDIRDRYVGSALGAAWSILQPLALVGILLVVFREMASDRVSALGIERSSTSYAVQTVSAFIPWFYTGMVLTASAAVIRTNQSLVSQIEFPVVILPAKVVMSAMMIQTTLLVLLIVYDLIVEGSVLRWTLFLLPLALALQFMFLLGISWLLAVIGMYFRDIEQALPTLVFINLYLLPIFFTPDAAPPAVASLVYWNPFTPMVEVFRSTITGTAFAQPEIWVAFGVISVFTFSLGWWLFKSLQGGFGDLY